LSGYDDTAGRQAYDRILADLRAHPMVAAAALGSSVPFGMEAESASVRDARSSPSSDAPGALVSLVSADYFHTLGVRVVRGREFDGREERAPSATRPAIVDHALASRLWPGQDPLGQRLQIRRGEAWDAPAEVVGVVASVREAPFDSEPPARVYLPAGQEYRGQAYLHLRLRSAGGGEASAIRSVRSALRSGDPSLAVLSIETLRGHRDRSIYMWIARASAALFSSLGIAALALAVLGVYGVKAYLVAQRRKEIAIRLALGATRQQVLGRIVGDGAAITAAGLVCGVLASVALTDLLEGWVAGTGGFPWLPFAAAAALLASTALVACWLPVRRATRSAPWAALRAE
jgi:hypothetical protein